MKFSFSLYKFIVLLPFFKRENLYFCIPKYLKIRNTTDAQWLSVGHLQGMGPPEWGKLICKDSLENKGAPELS